MKRTMVSGIQGIATRKDTGRQLRNRAKRSAHSAIGQVDRGPIALLKARSDDDMAADFRI
ncbi:MULTISPECIES: hypothetical protein [Pandoraea]|uniref:hypothetical protein n=1 Tax=Pandoraea TaxID=93217 RepID=UPI001F5DD406|nr:MULTISPECIES: hypothetical protein [Pandoraea]MCI3206376.1 hypothetical protein [Pandoraea sp. LA3]MDN4584404.1 hypothetical protein [Pandoraea capi]